VSSPTLVQRLSGVTETVRGWKESPLGQQLGRWFNFLLSALILLLLANAIADVGWQ